MNQDEEHDFTSTHGLAILSEILNMQKVLCFLKPVMGNQKLKLDHLYVYHVLYDVLK